MLWVCKIEFCQRWRLADAWSAPVSRTFGFKFDLNNFSERNHDFLFHRAVADLHVHFIGGNACDTLDNMLRPSRFHSENHVLFGFAPDERKITG